MKKQSLFFGMLLLASISFANVQFKWDFGMIGYGYSGHYKNTTEIDVFQIGIIGTKYPCFWEFSPISVYGNFKSVDQQIQFQKKELFLFNISTGYIFKLKDYFVFEPTLTLSWLEPTNLKKLSIKSCANFSLLYNMKDLDYIPNLMQRLITVSIATNFSSITNFKPQFCASISTNILWFLPLITN